MRITSGSLKGRKLILKEELSIRPTSEKLRQALFNILQNCIEGSSFLDICAGSGAIAIEAISRGAAQATCIERARVLCDEIQNNAKTFGIEKHLHVLQGDACTALQKLIATGKTFDTIYFDPPYQDNELIVNVFDCIEKNLSLLALDGTFFLELATKTPLPSSSGLLTLKKRRVFGDSCLLEFCKSL